MELIDRVVIGAGVVGLAVAQALAREGLQTLVLEAESSFGTGISSRNSEVIHAGIYYPQGSLKARLCTDGREWLYEFCARYGVPHRRCGKLIVATSEPQRASLEALRSRAAANGVDLQPLDGKALLELEPELAGIAGLRSPLTGIIDSHAYMLALIGLLESRGGTVVYGSRVSRMVQRHDGIAIGVNDEEPELLAGGVVNCAGLEATAVASAVEGLPQGQIPTTYLAKGSYFTVEGRAPFRHLIYPIPEPGGLGIHLTLDLAGRARVGPDVEWLDAPDYAVDPSRAELFYGAVRRYWPQLPEGSLRAAYAGIRPKMCGPGQSPADFRIDGPYGSQGRLVNLFGIESPGLTASLAIAEQVVERLGVAR